MTSISSGQSDTDRFEAMVNISDQSATIKVAGKEYRLGPMKLGLRCAAERHMRDERLEHFLGHPRALGMAPEFLADVIAKIESQSVTFNDVLLSFEGRLHTLYLAMRSVDPKITWDWVKDEMPPIATAILTELMYVLGGLKPATESESGNENPTEASTSGQASP